MAYKEVSRVEVIEIVRRWQTEAGMRALARGTGLSRNTIRKYIEAAERCGLTREVAEMDFGRLGLADAGVSRVQPAPRLHRRPGAGASPQG